MVMSSPTRVATRGPDLRAVGADGVSSTVRSEERPLWPGLTCCLLNIVSRLHKSLGVLRTAVHPDFVMQMRTG